MNKDIIKTLLPTAAPTQCVLSVNKPDLSLQLVLTRRTNLLPVNTAVNTVLRQQNVVRHLIDGDDYNGYDGYNGYGLCKGLLFL